MISSMAEYRQKAHKPVGLHGYDSRALAQSLVVENDGVSRVQVHEMAKVDINHIVRRFMQTGSAPMTNREGFYGDFSGVYDFDSALARVKEANEAFMKLPADVREHFGNDPGEFLRRADQLVMEDQQGGTDGSGAVAAAQDTGSSPS